jgi:hypothetical protein
MRWEYLVRATNLHQDNTHSLLQEAGADGWELVAIRPPDNNRVERFYFKRPLTEVKS